jgi:hypoxanthine phosphoribosyltransferase
MLSLCIARPLPPCLSGWSKVAALSHRGRRPTTLFGRPLGCYVQCGFLTRLRVGANTGRGSSRNPWQQEDDPWTDREGWRRTVDVVVVLENSFLFAADLVREIAGPVACHFVRAEMRDVSVSGHDYREIFFSAPPTLRGRDVLVVDAVLHTGVTQDFLLKRLEEGGPRSPRWAVLFDKAASRKVNLKAEYTGFAAASKEWVGSALSGKSGLYRNLPYVAGGISRARGRGRHASVRRKISKG